MGRGQREARGHLGPRPVSGARTAPASGRPYVNCLPGRYLEA